MKKFACVVVTYFPDKESIEHLTKLAALVDLLIIIDNTPESIHISHASNIIFSPNRANIGLAAALNRGIRMAGERGFEEIFLLDQDSRVPETYFTRMLEFKNRIDSCFTKCALYVPNVYDRNSGTYCRFPIVRKYYFRHRTYKKTSDILIDQGVIAITSGSLLPFSRYLTIGPLPEDYFIDFIDNEYCLRLAKKNFLVAVNFDITLDHAIGHRISKKFFGLTLKPNNHNPVRRYFIARNGIRAAICYFSTFPSFFLLVCLRIAHEMLTILFFESGKHEKERAILLGCADGLLGRMGAQRENVSN